MGLRIVDFLFDILGVGWMNFFSLLDFYPLTINKFMNILLLLMNDWFLDSIPLIQPII